MEELIDIRNEKFWDILFDEACVEGQQAERIEKALKAISTTEAEIRNKAIDEFAEALKKASIRGAFEYKPDKSKPWIKERSYCKVIGTRKIDEIAEQLKVE